MSTNSSTVAVVKPVFARSVASLPVRLNGDEKADSLRLEVRRHEEVHLVGEDRPAERGAVLPDAEAGEGRVVAIAGEALALPVHEGRAEELVRARLGDAVHHAAGEVALAHVVRRHHHLELRHRLERDRPGARLAARARPTPPGRRGRCSRRRRSGGCCSGCCCPAMDVPTAWGALLMRSVKLRPCSGRLWIAESPTTCIGPVRLGVEQRVVLPAPPPRFPPAAPRSA